MSIFIFKKWKETYLLCLLWFKSYKKKYIYIYEGKIKKEEFNFFF